VGTRARVLIHFARCALAIAIAIAPAGCVDETGVFTCTSDTMCVRAGVQGTCEATQHCSFLDMECSSGRRYTEHAADALAGVCVAEACPGNLVVNPSFDTGTSGWIGVNANLSLVPGRVGTGLGACFTSGSYFNATDMPSTVQAPVQGTRYRLSLWAHAPTRSADAYATLREIGPTDYVDQVATPFTSSSSWQEVVVSYTIMRSDSIALEVYAGMQDSVAGDCLAIDDVCLVTVP
jgi:hypothetical protein